jgi:hypothetical protein
MVEAILQGISGWKTGFQNKVESFLLLKHVRSFIAK